MDKAGYKKYTERLKSFIKYALENYFSDGPANLGEVLGDQNLSQYYVKFYNHLHRNKPFTSSLDYETLVQLSMIDPKRRAPLQVRAYLMNEKLPKYESLTKSDLVNLLIDLTNKGNQE